MIRNRLLILFSVCSIAWAACTQQRQICLTPKIAILNIECMHEPTDSSIVPVDTALPAAIFVAITTKGADSVQYINQQSSFSLSLSPVATVCQWSFTTDSTKFNYFFDTLTFYYEKNLQFLSNACGYTYFYSLDSVQCTHHNVDSILITSKSVTNNVNTKHLQVYMHTKY